MDLQDRNVVLVVADTLSAFHLPLYGYDRDTAPFLTEMGRKGCYAPYAYANGPYTVPSHGSMFSGQLPSEHLCVADTMYFGARSFVEDLREDGYNTLAVSNNAAICPAFGFGRGFEEFIVFDTGTRMERAGLDALATVWRREKADEYNGRRDRIADFAREALVSGDFASVRRALSVKAENPRARLDAFLDDSGAAATNELVADLLPNREEPFFLFLNYIEPHRPYDPPAEVAARFVDDVGAAKQRHTSAFEPHGKAFRWADFSEEILDVTRRLYDAEVRYLDKHLQSLYQQVTATHPDTVFIFVGDHGENLGEYGMQGHQCGLWEKLLRVPFVVAGESVPDTVIEGNVSLRDVASLLTGEVDLGDLGRERVYAEYTGLGGMLNTSGRSKEEFDSEELQYVQNSGTAVVDGRRGAVAHSHLPDVGFQARPDGIDLTADRPDADLLRAARARFGVSETAAMDI